MRLGAHLAVLGLAGTLALSPTKGGACEDTPPIQGISEPRTSLSISVGGAWAAVHLFGGVHDPGQGTAILEGQLRRTFKVKETLAIDYLVGVVPVELQKSNVVVADSMAPLGTTLDRATVYGGGLNPVGVEVRFRRGDWRPFATASGGLRFFKSEVPNPRASRTNFVADVGLGVLRRIGGPRWLALSLDLHHVSNGGLADSNPGINQFVLSVGYLRMR